MNTLGAAGNLAANSNITLAANSLNTVLLSGLSPSDLAQLNTIAGMPHPASGGSDQETLGTDLWPPASQMTH